MQDLIGGILSLKITPLTSADIATVKNYLDEQNINILYFNDIFDIKYELDNYKNYFDFSTENIKISYNYEGNINLFKKRFFDQLDTYDKSIIYSITNMIA